MPSVPRLWKCQKQASHHHSSWIHVLFMYTISIPEHFLQLHIAAFTPAIYWWWRWDDGYDTSITSNQSMHFSSHKHRWRCENTWKSRSWMHVMGLDLIVSAKEKRWKQQLVTDNDNTSAVFQAALVSIHNAKSDNQSVQQQGIHNLTQCAELHEKENAFSSSQIAGLLKKLATRYAVFNGQQHGNDVILFCPLAATQDSVASTSPSTTDNGSSPSQNNEQGHSVIHNALLDNGQDTMPPTSLLNNELQFDLASLTSDIPLWNAPSGVTRTDWDPFLQQPSL